MKFLKIGEIKIPQTKKRKKEYMKKFMRKVRREKKYEELKDIEAYMKKHENDPLRNIPLNPNCESECLKFRRMHLARIPRDAIFIQNHITCKWCDLWKRENKIKLVSQAGFDLWHGSEQEKHDRRNRQIREACEELGIDY